MERNLISHTALADPTFGMVAQLVFQQFQSLAFFFFFFYFIYLFIYLFLRFLAQQIRNMVFVCPYLFCFLIMANERGNSLQSVSVRLDGKNYLYWSYVMRNFLKGKKSWGYVTKTCVKPKSNNENYVAELDKWEANNSKIIT